MMIRGARASRLSDNPDSQRHAADSGIALRRSRRTNPSLASESKPRRSRSTSPTSHAGRGSVRLPNEARPAAPHSGMPCVEMLSIASRLRTAVTASVARRDRRSRSTRWELSRVNFRTDRMFNNRDGAALSPLPNEPNVQQRAVRGPGTDPSAVAVGMPTRGRKGPARFENPAHAILLRLPLSRSRTGCYPATRPRCRSSREALGGPRPFARSSTRPGSRRPCPLPPHDPASPA